MGKSYKKSNERQITAEDALRMMRAAMKNNSSGGGGNVGSSYDEETGELTIYGNTVVYDEETGNLSI